MTSLVEHFRPSESCLHIKGNNPLPCKGHIETVVIPLERQLLKTDRSDEGNRFTRRNSWAIGSCLLSLFCVGVLVQHIWVLKDLRDNCKCAQQDVLHHQKELSELSEMLEMKLLAQLESTLTSQINDRLKKMLHNDQSLNAGVNHWSSKENLQQEDSQLAADEKKLALRFHDMLNQQLSAAVEEKLKEMLRKLPGNITDEHAQTNFPAREETTTPIPRFADYLRKEKLHKPGGVEVLEVDGGLREPKVTTKQQDLSSQPVKNRTSRHRPESILNLRRKKRDTTKLLYFVHLRGRGHGHIVDAEGNFLWNAQHTTYSTGFRYIPDPAFGAIVRVKIKTHGVYLVYSQVAVHGNNYTDGVSLPLECAHETRKTSVGENDEGQVLLRSLLTQVNLGRRLDLRGPPLNAIDTKLQMGVFVFNPNDEIRVKFNEDCNNFNYVMSPEFSYFGLVKLA